MYISRYKSVTVQEAFINIYNLINTEKIEVISDV